MAERILRRRKRQGGDAIIELALVSTFLIPLMSGTYSVGLSLGRNIQVAQVARDAGHMYVRWVDFSLPANQDIIVRLASGLEMTRTGGNGEVVLSKVAYVTTADCTAANISSAACTNANQPVFVQRIAFGNTSLRPSAFGTPPASLIQTNGDILPSNYLTNTAFRANGFGSVLPLATGEVAFVAETYFITPEFNLPGQFTTGGIYARSIY
ncbi:MAG: hypothetical protein FJW40_17765 [Acidobacteria bacterium]|nr:hypothetical protein [Acidobacteriota bacterium]